MRYQDELQHSVSREKSMGVKLQRILLWIAVGTAALVSWSADASTGQDLTTHDAAEGNDFGR